MTDATEHSVAERFTTVYDCPDCGENAVVIRHDCGEMIVYCENDRCKRCDNGFWPGDPVFDRAWAEADGKLLEPL